MKSSLLECSFGATTSMEGESIFIPRKERGRAMSRVHVSVRLRHLFEKAKVRLAGDLHGRSYSEMAQLRNSGPKTIAELREFVGEFQALGAGAILAEDSATFASPPVFRVAPKARGLKPSDLPLSKRLSHLFQKLGCRTLGSVDGCEEQELARVKNCGRHTIRELHELLGRAAAGEFTVKNNGSLEKCLSEVTRAIDKILRAASARNRKIFEQRLAGNRGFPRSLRDVGARFELECERVRQIVTMMLGDMRKVSGPLVGEALETVARVCQQRGCLLTEELFGAWLGQSGTELSRRPGFYLRVIYMMAPHLPVEMTGFNDVRFLGRRFGRQYPARPSAPRRSVRRVRRP